mmetsp:Transcript_33169/g.74929  ORF Transcript_33169/g.74929 Transcript_33169/m.74929 type:complete len:236 (+) Transcript_33169:303-1010(+)
MAGRPFPSCGWTSDGPWPSCARSSHEQSESTKKCKQRRRRARGGKYRRVRRRRKRTRMSFVCDSPTARSARRWARRCARRASTAASNSSSARADPQRRASCTSSASSSSRRAPGEASLTPPRRASRWASTRERAWAGSRGYSRGSGAPPGASPTTNYLRGMTTKFPTMTGCPRWMMMMTTFPRWMMATRRPSLTCSLACSLGPSPGRPSCRRPRSSRTASVSSGPPALLAKATSP